MAMGRPPKPDALKQRLGTARPDRERAAMVVLPSGAKPPAAPRDLGRLGRRMWREFWQLGEAWLSPRTDLQLVLRLCRLYDEEAALYALVREHGYTVRGAMGGDVLNPEAAQLRKAQELITRLEGLCGFTPSDRTRLGLAEVQRQSKFDELMARRAKQASN